MPTIAIGLDAFEWWYAEQLLQAGRLPNLRALMERGTSCRLDNHMLYRSEFAWTRFLTGAEPLEDRLWSPGVVFEPEDYRARNTLARATKPFYAGRPGPVIAFDAIHTVIAEDVDGDQVTAWGSHAPQYPRTSSPAGLLREIDARFGASPAAGNEHTFGWYDERYLANLEAALGGRRGGSCRSRSLAHGASTRVAPVPHCDVGDPWGRPPLLARSRSGALFARCRHLRPSGGGDGGGVRGRRSRAGPDDRGTR